MQKIKLEKEAGPIVFLGTMNAMPMMYAWELKSKGYEVIYFVDVSTSDTLSRPENHFSNIEYPYPNWIVEITLKTQFIVPFTHRIIRKLIRYRISQLSSKQPQLYVLNGFFISLAPYYENSQTIALSHGADLNPWADIEKKEEIAKRFQNISFLKHVPSYLSKALVKKAIHNQYEGFLKSDLAVYFPIGFDSRGDQLVKKLEHRGINTYRRYDVSFDPLRNASRKFKKESKNLVIFSGVRFCFLKGKGERFELSKGNDHIINGLARYYQENKNIEVHFVEKGVHLQAAKELCDNSGLSPVITWHKEMEFYKLLKLYEQSDICFGQVGNHWISAIGAYALYLGKPLIANDNSAVSSGLWPENNPVIRASNPEEVYNALKVLEPEKVRETVSLQSKDFAEKYFSVDKFMNEVFDM